MESFAEYAEADLANLKAGPKDDVRPGDDDLGGFKHSNVKLCRALSFVYYNCTTASETAVLPAQDYTSKARAQSGYRRMNYLCPYRHRCGCMVALAVKEFPDRYELHHSGNHHRHSHRDSSGILSVKQRNAIITAVKSSPMAARGTVQGNLKKFSS